MCSAPWEWDMQVLPQDFVALSQWGAAVGFWDSPGRGHRGLWANWPG